MQTQQVAQATFLVSLDQATGPLFSIDGHQLRLADDITYEGWLTAVGHLKGLQSQSTVYLADAIEQGVVKFGQISVDKGLEQLEFDMPTMNVIKSITGVPAAERNEKLEPAHYVVLKKADLTPSARKEWIQKAADQNLTPADLKVSIKAGEVVSGAVTKQVNSGVYSPHGIAGEFEVWLRRMGGVEGVMKKERDTKLMIVREFAPIASLHADLVKQEEQYQKRAREEK